MAAIFRKLHNAKLVGTLRNSKYAKHQQLRYFEV
jgi:hypothetical protein